MARKIAIELLTMVGIALVLAAIGPFGSFAMGGFATRLAYWLPITLLGYLIFRPLTWYAGRIERWLGVSNLVATAITVLVAAIPGTFVVIWWGGFEFAAMPAFADIFDLYVRVALLGGVITLFFLLLERGSAKGETEGVASAAQAQPIPFLDRLPPSWNNKLVALEMEDHYVRAHGPDGASVLILMRMADAERELAGADGARVHRSWWVMRDAVTGTSREGRAVRLALAGGLSAPVARDRIADLKTRGWPL